MIQDMVNNFDGRVANAPATRTTGTANGITINRATDPKGESVSFIIFTGARTDGTYTPLIEDSANGSSWAAVADADLIGAGTTQTGQEADAALSTANAAKRIGYSGSKQYVRCSIVATLATTGAVVGAVAVIGNLQKKSPSN